MITVRALNSFWASGSISVGKKAASGTSGSAMREKIAGERGETRDEKPVGQDRLQPAAFSSLVSRLSSPVSRLSSLPPKSRGLFRSLQLTALSGDADARGTIARCANQREVDPSRGIADRHGQCLLRPVPRMCSLQDEFPFGEDVEPVATLYVGQRVAGPARHLNLRARERATRGIVEYSATDGPWHGLRLGELHPTRHRADQKQCCPHHRAVLP